MGKLEHLSRHLQLFHFTFSNHYDSNVITIQANNMPFHT